MKLSAFVLSMAAAAYLGGSALLLILLSRHFS